MSVNKNACLFFTEIRLTFVAPYWNEVAIVLDGLL